MFSIFSTQNLQTFLRRKNLRPPSRGGPPGPERPPKRGRSPPGRSPRGPSPPDRCPSRGASPAGRSAAGVLISSAISLLRSVASDQWSVASSCAHKFNLTGHWPLLFTPSLEFLPPVPQELPRQQQVAR